MNNIAVGMSKTFDMAGIRTLKNTGKGGSFMDLMAALTNGNSEAGGILDLMGPSGNVLTENTVMDGINAELISNMKGLENYLNSGDTEQTKPEDMNSIYAYISSLMSNMAGMQMLGISDPVNGPEEASYMMNTGLEAIANSSDYLEYLRKSGDFEKNLNELLNFKGKETLVRQNEPQEVPVAVSAGSRDMSEKAIPEGISVYMEEMTAKASAGEADKHEDSTKGNGDILAAEAGNERLLQKYDGRIIEVSDESSEIRPGLNAQIKDKIVLMADENKDIQEVVLELFPKNLGRVNIKMSMQDDRLTIDILASNDKTKNILLESTDELLGSLQKSLNDKPVHITIASSNAPEQGQHTAAYEEQQRENQRNNRGRYFSQDDSREEDNKEESFKEMMNLRDLVLNKM